MELQKIFNYEGARVRTMMIDDEVWFVGRDVAEVLGYKRTADAIRQHVIGEDKGVGETQTPGGKQGMTIINESGLYDLIFSSKLDGARKFRRWVTSEVLPTIRKTGSYSTKPSYMIQDEIERAKAWIVEQEEKRELELENKMKDQVIGELQPIVDYTDNILQAEGLTPIRNIAKDYGMSAQAMNKMLHRLEIQYNQSNQWLLYSDYQDKGYTQSKTTQCRKRDGSYGASMSTQWTQKGRLFLYELLKEEGILPVMEQEI